MELAPNDPDVLAPLGFLIAVHGRWERGVQVANKARELNLASAGGWMISTLYYDYHRRGMYREALEVVNEVTYNAWRTFDHEDTLRFHALRLYDFGMIKSAIV